VYEEAGPRKETIGTGESSSALLSSIWWVTIAFDAQLCGREKCGTVIVAGGRRDIDLFYAMSRN